MPSRGYNTDRLPSSTQGEDESPSVWQRLPRAVLISACVTAGVAYFSRPSLPYEPLGGDLRGIALGALALALLLVFGFERAPENPRHMLVRLVAFLITFYLLGAFAVQPFGVALTFVPGYVLALAAFSAFFFFDPLGRLTPESEGRRSDPLGLGAMILLFVLISLGWFSLKRPIAAALPDSALLYVATQGGWEDAVVADQLLHTRQFSDEQWNRLTERLITYRDVQGEMPGVFAQMLERTNRDRIPDAALEALLSGSFRVEPESAAFQRTDQGEAVRLRSHMVLLDVDEAVFFGATLGGVTLNGRPLPIREFATAPLASWSTSVEDLDTPVSRTPRIFASRVDSAPDPPGYPLLVFPTTTLPPGQHTLGVTLYAYATTPDAADAALRHFPWDDAGAYSQPPAAFATVTRTVEFDLTVPARARR